MSKYTISECKTLIENNISVVVADQYKKPLWSAWQSKQITFTQFSRYYKKADAKITGIVCTNNIECIDVDLKILPESKRDSEFKKMITFFADQIDDFHKKFFVQRTPSKGFHIVYKCKFTESNKKIAFVETESDKFECLIETRGSGGYFGIYKNLNIFGSAFNIPEITTHERDIIMHCCESFNEKLAHEKVSKQAVKEHSQSTVTPWDDYDSKTDVFEVVQSIFDIVGKTPKGYQIKRIGGSKSSHHSGYIYTDRNIMFLFSGNSIFPAEIGLSPSACLAHRDFNGDFAECAKYLYDQGYGDRKPTTEIEQVEMPSSDGFPVEIFPQPVIKYINAVHKESGLPVDFLASAILFVYSVICGTTFGIRTIFGGVQFPAIWICLITGTGRFKSPAIKRAILPLIEIEDRMHKTFINEMKKYKQAQENQKKGQKTAEDAEPIDHIIYVENTTFEALADDLQNNEHGVGYIKDELKGMMTQFNKYSGGDNDMSQWLEIWNGGALKLRRKQAKKARISNVYVPLIGGIQPDIIHSIIDDENKSSGFVDRFLFVSNYDEMPMLNDFEMSNHIERQYINHMIKGFETMTKLKRNSIMYLNDDAKDEIREFCNQARTNMNAGDMIGFDGMFAKSQAYIHRLTALCHLMHEMHDHQGGQVSAHVDVTSVQRAKLIMTFFEQHGIHTRKKQSVDLEKMQTLKYLKMKGATTKKQQAIELFKQYNGSIKYDEIAQLVGYNSKQAVEYHLKKDNACVKLMKSRK